MDVLQLNRDVNSFCSVNPVFSGFRSFLLEELDLRRKNMKRDSKDVAFYRTPTSQNLLSFSKRHASKLSNLQDYDSFISLTHPFYLFLTHFNTLNERGASEARFYLDSLGKLLLRARESLNIGVVSFEDLHHYPFLTSRLLEEGYVDRVVFTEYDDGYPIDFRDIDFLRGKEVYVGGGYDELCLQSTIESLNTVSRGNIWGIRDTSIKGPCKDLSLTVNSITGILNGTISLDEAIQRMSLAA